MINSSRLKVIVIIPTYNESANVPKIVAGLSALNLGLDILFIDDSSPDGTAEIIKDLTVNDSRIKLLKRSAKLGIGSAHRDGLMWAYDHGYTYAITMDCDLTHDPSILPMVMSLGTKADVVVGSRHLTGNSLPGWTLWRRTLTKLGSLLIRFILKIPYDATGALRGYNLKTVPREIFNLARSDGYAFLFESLFLLWKNGKRIVEFPISLPARTAGSSKMSKSQIALSLLRLYYIYLMYRVGSDIFELRSPLSRNPTALLRSNYQRDWQRRLAFLRETPSLLLYQILSIWYGHNFTRPLLTRMIEREFTKNSTLLHTEAGTGQIDVTIRHLYRIVSINSTTRAAADCWFFNEPYEEILVGDLQNLPFKSASFDGVYFFGLQESLHDDELHVLFSQVARVLSTRGKLVIFFPSQTGFARMIAKTLKVDGRSDFHKRQLPDELFILAEKYNLKLLSNKRYWRDLLNHRVLVFQNVF